VPAVLTQPVSAPVLTVSLRSPVYWWHLLSLDAPAIAAVWAFTFARAFQVHLPWYSYATLALGTWCVYVADRLLDGWLPKPAATLRERHRFYARHRKIFAAVLLAALLTLAYFLLLRVAVSVRREDLLLGAVGVLYFALIHAAPLRRPRAHRTWLPKELAVGVLFASAVAAPECVHLHGQAAWMLLAVTCFAGLCCWNCVAIQTWEDAETEAARHGEFVHPLTRWLGARLFACGLALSLLAASLFLAAPNAAFRVLPASALCSGILFLLLHRGIARLHARTLRVAVDLALLTPLIFLVRL
jgi:hypothetical protein